MQKSFQNLVFSIQDKSCQLVMAITGGGTEVIGELLRYGGGSKTLSEAVVPYSQPSFDSFVKGKPDKYCSITAARDLAMASFQRAIFLNPNSPLDKLIGLGATSSLTKESERAGREHKIHIAVQTADKTFSFSPSLVDVFGRLDQETKTAEFILKMIAFSCGIETDLSEVDIFKADKSICNVVLGFEKLASKSIQNNLDSSKDRIIFSGAFNPIHEHHISMIKKIKEIKSIPVDLELCVRNVDKPALNYKEIDNRLKFIENLNLDCVEKIHLTGCSTFAEKSKCFPNCSFLVGWDTLVRICDPKYGKLDEVIDCFKKNRIKFLVFHRISNGESTEKESLDKIHPQILEISEFFGSNVLSPSDISSTKIRKGEQE
jgi:nicotinic acid mononucleotide adenylyltransferase